MKPICIPCQRFFKVIKNDYYFTEGSPAIRGTNPGIEEKERWQPYRVWAGDQYKCPGCGTEIVSGIGHGPLAIKHEPDFKAKHSSLGADRLQVNG